MPAIHNSKQKLLAIARMMQQETDEQHPISVPELIARLEKMGIPAERKSVYDDLDVLKSVGMNIENSKRNGYYVQNRAFELSELKLLVDAVQACRSISERKSVQLIGKLKGLTSIHQAKQLQRQVFVSGRAKSMNEGLFYNIDALHDAIHTHRKIEFQYYEYGVDKQLHLRRGGELYRVSPYLLCWEDENYYLVAYHERYEALSHFRVDKMKEIRILEETVQECEIDSAKYAQQTFGMFASDAKAVELLIPADKIGILIDRFGKNIFVMPMEDGRLSVQLHIAISPAFYSWVFMLGSEVRISYPPEAAAEYQKRLHDALEPYEKK